MIRSINYACQAFVLCSFSVALGINPSGNEIVPHFSESSETPSRIIFQGSTDPDNFRFFLYNNGSDIHSFEELIYQNGSVQDSSFIIGAPVVVLTHGFRSKHDSSDDTTFPQTVKNEYLREQGGTRARNIIILDWSSLSSPNQSVIADAYILAAGNIVVPGKRLADVLGYYIKNNFTTFSDIHLVGHSLGAHVSGAAGDEINKRFGQKLDRISGLDPAGPGFYYLNRPLRKEDATFVDIIHTSRGTYGIFLSIGHVDFHSDLGTLVQPGCETGTFGVVVDLVTLGTCSHSESHRIFSRSINDKGIIACKSDDFCYLVQRPTCLANSTIGAIVGEHVDRSKNPEGNYYFNARNILVSQTSMCQPNGHGTKSAN